MNSLNSLLICYRDVFMMIQAFSEILVMMYSKKGNMQKIVQWYLVSWTLRKTAGNQETPIL